MLKRVVVTRPQEDSERLSETLMEKGFQPLVEPLTLVKYFPDTDIRLMPYIAQNATLLATSRHAALAPHGCPPHVPWIASGYSTLHALKSVGCENVTLAGQTAELLRNYLAARSPDHLPYVYLAGRHRTLNLEETLEPLGYSIHTVEVYEAREQDKFSEPFVRSLKEAPADAVLLFSSRHAEIFETLIKKEGLEQSLAHTQAFCLSENIASQLTLPWKKVHASDHPETPELLALLETL